MNRLCFSKMHGLGNDFMIIDGVRQRVSLTSSQIQSWGDRRRGVGFDQLLLLCPPRLQDVDFSVRIYNCDGSDAAHCGNGMRCLMRFIRAQRLSGKERITVEIQRKKVILKWLGNGWVEVSMGTVDFAWARVPFTPPQAQRDPARAEPYQLQDGEQAVHFLPLSLGNPHAVIYVDDLESAAVQRIGAMFNQHSWFPQQVNVGFVQKMDGTTIRLRVFERGVGETPACGSGACAAVVAGQMLYHLASEVTVLLNGGTLMIVRNIADPDASILMRGATADVFDGNMDISI